MPSRQGLIKGLWQALVNAIDSVVASFSGTSCLKRAQVLVAWRVTLLSHSRKVQHGLREARLLRQRAERKSFGMRWSPLEVRNGTEDSESNSGGWDCQ